MGALINKQTSGIQAITLQQALQRGEAKQLTKVAAKLDETALDREDDMRAELELKLYQLRADYRRAVKITEQELRDKALMTIEKEGNAVRTQLNALAPARMSIGKMAKSEAGRVIVVDDVTLMVLWVNDCVNVSRPLTETQILTIAEAVVTKYGWLRTEDVMIAMRRGAFGEYGSVYERLDVEAVMKWVERYANELQHARHLRQTNKHLEQKYSRAHYPESLSKQPSVPATAYKEALEVISKWQPIESKKA